MEIAKAKQLMALSLAAVLAACSDAPNEATDSAEAHATASSAKPPRSHGSGAAGAYPIVLAHGLFGFEQFAGIDFIDYFYKVKGHLAAHGERAVFTPAVDPFNDSDYRGKQLLAHVERIVRETGAARVNIIGHSQGGLDARYVAHERPDLVASVVTFATPHDGSELSDIALGLVDSPVIGSVIDAFTRVLGGPLWDEIGNETSLARSVRQLSRPAMHDFNARYPDVPGIPYWSIAGRTALSLGGDLCDVADAPQFIHRWKDERDTTEPLFKPTELILSGFSRTPNDGLVIVESARHGKFLGCVPADHLDEIGHLFGGSAGWFNQWNHLDFYTELVAWVRAQGL
jgi:triacylglycerol lipase